MARSCTAELEEALGVSVSGGKGLAPFLAHTPYNSCASIVARDPSFATATPDDAMIDAFKQHLLTLTHTAGKWPSAGTSAILKRQCHRGGAAA